MPGDRGRSVKLREEHQGDDDRYLDAYIDGAGDLVLAGQDLGLATELVSPDGEYEWFRIVRRPHRPALVVLLGGQAGADVLDVLADGWTGSASYELEALLRDGAVPSEVHVV